MQDMIAQIVEMDEKARRMTEQAQQDKLHAEQEIAIRREQIEQEYLERARERLKKNEQTERELAIQALKESEAKNAEAAKRLDAQYQEKAEQWVQQLFERVIGE